MNRDEFLNEMRLALQGKIAQSRVNEHLRYYENYIIEESRKGRTEAEVLESLGNPRLIAKTIIETEESHKKLNEDDRENHSDTTELRNRIIHIKPGVVGVIVLLAILVIIAFAAKLLSILFPVLLPVLVIGSVIYLFNSGKK